MSDIFLQFPKPAQGGQPVLGESVDAKFKDAIDVMEFGFGEENATTIGSATSGAGAGKVQFKEITVRKRVDRASPSLSLMCATGAHFPEAVLSIRKTGGNAAYLTYNFGTVFVSKVAWANTDEAVEETVTFVCGAIKVSYWQQDATGKLAPSPATMSWSQITNKSEYIPS